MARELILSEKCDFLAGPTSSAVALAVTKVAKEFKKIVFFHTSNAESITTTDFQPYMFQVVPNTGIEGRGMALFLSQKPYKRYGLIGPDYAYGHDQLNSFKRKWQSSSPMRKFSIRCGLKIGESNLSPFIPTLMAKSPDAIYSAFWGGQLSSLIKQGIPYGIFKKASLSSLFDLDFLRTTGADMPEGLTGYARCPFYAVDTPEMKAFTKNTSTSTKNGLPTGSYGLRWNGALTEAIKKANSIDSEQVVKVIGGLQVQILEGRALHPCGRSHGQRLHICWRYYQGSQLQRIPHYEGCERSAGREGLATGRRSQETAGRKEVTGRAGLAPESSSSEPPLYAELVPTDTS